MDGHEDDKRPATGEKRAPIDIEGAPSEEGVSPADAAARLDLDPEEQVNRPDQPDADPAERRQFENPDEATSIADADHPEDR